MEGDHAVDVAVGLRLQGELLPLGGVFSLESGRAADVEVGRGFEPLVRAKLHHNIIHGEPNGVATERGAVPMPDEP